LAIRAGEEEEKKKKKIRDIVAFGWDLFLNNKQCAECE